jgi:hypothetical protein
VLATLLLAVGGRSEYAEGGRPRRHGRPPALREGQPRTPGLQANCLANASELPSEITGYLCRDCQPLYRHTVKYEISAERSASRLESAIDSSSFCRRCDFARRERTEPRHSATLIRRAACLMGCRGRDTDRRRLDSGVPLVSHSRGPSPRAAVCVL